MAGSCEEYLYCRPLSAGRASPPNCAVTMPCVIRLRAPLANGAKIESSHRIGQCNHMGVRQCSYSVVVAAVRCAGRQSRRGGGSDGGWCASCRTTHFSIAGHDRPDRAHIIRSTASGSSRAMNGSSLSYDIMGPCVSLGCPSS